MGRVINLHIANPGLIPRNANGSTTTSKTDPEAEVNPEHS